MSTFKERMQPVIDALPAGEDRDTLIALVDTHDSLEQAGFKPGRSTRALRQYLHQASGRVSAGRASRPGKPAGNRQKPK